MFYPTREQDIVAERLALRFARVECDPVAEDEGNLHVRLLDHPHYRGQGMRASPGLVIKAYATITPDGKVKYS